MFHGCPPLLHIIRIAVVLLNAISMNPVNHIPMGRKWQYQKARNKSQKLLPISDSLLQADLYWCSGIKKRRLSHLRLFL